MDTASSVHKFDHLVVLMLENRSFDHLMGYLYEDGEPAHFVPDGDRVFRGASGRTDLVNLDDSDPPRRVPVHRAPFETLEEMNVPFPDPGEEMDHVLYQMFGVEDPARHYNDLHDPAPMSGFVRDYLRVAGQYLDRRDPPPSDAQLAEEIMRCFPPQATPVLSGLARAFAVSDAWFASVPSQTYCNRSFLHAASSSGFVRNANYVKWSQNTAPTVFELLAGRFPPREGFRIYWDARDILPLTRLIHRPLYEDRFNDSFAVMEELEADCASGDLPAYSFIQPRILIDHNDMHPAYFRSQTADSSVLAGEDLVARVYDAVRKGPRWGRTLLVILFDEHGGTYDHVPPPAGAAPPHGSPAHELEDGFRFDRFGPRVPAIFISPYIEPGTVLRASGPVPFDHTSVIKTLTSRWGLPSLTDRDRAAPPFDAVLTRPLDQPRLDTPSFTPREHTGSALGDERSSPLFGLKKALLVLAAHSRGLGGLNFKSLGEALDFFL